jgi:hypothetical protein
MALSLSGTEAAPLGLLAGQILARQHGIHVVRKGWYCDGEQWEIDYRPLKAFWPLWAAVAEVSGPTGRTGETQNNSFTLDATGADFLMANLSGLDAGFAGIANQISSGPTFNSNAGTQLAIVTGGTGANGQGVWGWNSATLPASTATFAVNFTDSSFAGGPKIGYVFLSGVNQGASPSDAVRSTGQDNSLGTSISLALTGLTVGDYCTWMLVDLSDTAHTPSTLTEVFESTTNSWTLAWGTLVADAASETAGWTGGTNCTGLAIALIPAGGTAYDIAADSASYIWTGQTAALLYASEIDAESASYAWTGQAATLKYIEKLVAEAAGWLWTGQAVTLTQGFSISADAGQWLWAGQDVSLLSAFKVPAEAVAWAWEGQDVTLLTSGYEIDAEAALWAWTGDPVTLKHIESLAADPAAWSWAGQNVTLRLIQTLTIKTQTQYEVYILNPKNSRWEQTRIVFTGDDFGLVQ